MSDKKPNQKHFKKKAPELTPEEKAAALKAAEERVAQQKAEQERIRLYNASVKSMSHRQLVGELRRTVRREPPGFTLALGTVLLTVLQNTRTSPIFETDENGKPTRVARLDQINQLGRLHAYPR